MGTPENFTFDWGSTTTTTGDAASAKMQNWSGAYSYVYYEPPPPEAPLVSETLMTPRKRVNRFLIGCDPEFVVLSGNNKPVPLSHLPNGEFGWDHAGRVGELRPAAAMNVGTLLARMKRILQANKNIVEGRWRAGAWVGGEALGGHFHYNKQPPLDGTPKELKALDRVTLYLENLDILPREASLNRRYETDYGRFGDWRPSGTHIEYRTMASWLYHPRVAAIALTLAKLAASQPKLALEALLAQNQSYRLLQQFLERFKDADDDACELVEEQAVVPEKLKISQFLEQDIREAWKL